MATKHPVIKTFDTSEEFEEFRFDDDGLTADGIYQILDFHKGEERWAYSPDGIGCYWYNSKAELLEDAEL